MNGRRIEKAYPSGGEKALKFSCQNCGKDIVVKFLKIGETAKCKSCSSGNVIPDTATETIEEPDYLKEPSYIDTTKGPPIQEEGDQKEHAVTDYPTHIYLQMKGNEIGPYTLNQTKNLWQNGTVTADALFRYEGQEAWEPISKIIDTLETNDHLKSALMLKGIKCDKCGVLLATNQFMNSIVCNFCGNPLNIEEAKYPVEIRKGCFIIPFKVAKEQFNNKMLNWLVEGKYTPDDILYNFNIQENLGIYLPLYHFSINYRGYWTAEIRHERTETYTDYEDVYESGRYRRRPVTKTRTVPYWVPSSGQFSGSFTGGAIASAKLTEPSTSFCDGSDLSPSKMRSFDDTYITGFLIEACSIPSDSILRNKIKPKLEKKIDTDVNSMIPVNTLIPALGKMNVRWQIDTTGGNLTEKVIYLPYWLTTYYYKGKPYQCIVDGQNGNRIEGSKPIDKERKKKVSSFFYPLIISAASYFVVMITMIVLLTVNSNRALSSATSAICYYIGLFGLIPSIVFAIIGLIKRHKLLDESKRLRQKILKEFLI